MFSLDKLIDFGIYAMNWVACNLNVNKQAKEKVWYEITYEDYLEIKTLKVFAISEEAALFKFFGSLDWYIPEIKSIELIEKVILTSTPSLKPYADNYSTKKITNLSYAKGSDVKVYYTDLVTGNKVEVGKFKTITLKFRDTSPYINVYSRSFIYDEYTQIAWVVEEGNTEAIAEAVNLSNYFNIEYTGTDGTIFSLTRTKIDCYSKLNYPSRIEGIGGTLTRQPTSIH